MTIAIGHYIDVQMAIEHMDRIEIRHPPDYILSVSCVFEQGGCVNRGDQGNIGSLVQAIVSVILSQK
jgi:hypothetical protein